MGYNTGTDNGVAGVNGGAGDQFTGNANFEMVDGSNMSGQRHPNY